MPSTPASLARRTSSGWQMPLSSRGRSVSSRSQARSSQVRLGLPNVKAHWIAAAPGSSSGGTASFDAEDRVGEVVGEAVAAQLREGRVLQVAGTVAERPGVEGDHDPLEAGGLGATDEALGQLAVVGCVELEEARGVAERRGDVLHRVLHQRRRHHRDAGRGRRCGGRDVAVLVVGHHAEHADRRHEDRRRVGVAEQLDRQVALGGAGQHPRQDAPALEGGDVAALGVLVAGTAGDVVPEPVLHLLLRGLLEAREGERVRREVAAEACEVETELEVGVVRHADIQAARLRRWRRPGSGSR